LHEIALNRLTEAYARLMSTHTPVSVRPEVAEAGRGLSKSGFEDCS